MADATVEILIDGKDGLSAPAKRASNALAGLQSAAKSSGSALAGITQTAAGFAAAMGGMSLIGAAFSGLKDAVVGFNASMEQSQIAWSTLLKSGDAAKVMLDDLYQFAARTPFEFPELERASKRLLAMGFAAKDIIPLMTDIGNATSALGAGQEGINRIVTALGQMRAKGKVSAEEMMQLAELGVPAWQMLAQAMGKSTAEVMKLSSEGKIAANTMIDAFRGFSQQNYAGMMEKQSRTFLGVISTIRDNLRMRAADAFQPLFAQLSEAARRFADFVQSADFRAFSQSIASTVGQLIAVFSQLSPPVQQGIALFAGLAAAAATIIPVIGMVAPVLSALVGPIGIVAAAVAGLYVAWQTNFLGIRDTVMAILPQVANVALSIVGSIVGFFDENIPKLQEIVESVLWAIQTFWKNHGEGIAKIVGTIWDWLVEAFNEMMAQIGDIISLVLNVIKGNWSGALNNLGDILARAWRNIVKTMATAAKAVTGILREIFRAFGLSELIGDWESAIDGIAASTIEFGAVTAEAAEHTDDYTEAGRRQVSQAAKGRAMTLAWANDIMSKFVPAQKSAWQQFREQERAWNNAEAALDRNKQASDAAASGMANAGKKAKEAGLNVGDMVKALVATHPASIAAANAVAFWQSQVDVVNLAIEANRDQLKAAQRDLQGMQDHLSSLNEHLSNLKEQLSKAQQQLEEFARPRLTGMGELEDQISAVEAQIKRVQLARSLGVPLQQVISQYPLLTQGAEDYLSTLPKTEQELEKILEQLRLVQSLRYDEKLRLLERAAKPPPEEITYEQALTGIAATRAQIDNLTASIAAQEAAIKSVEEAIKGQELVIRGIQDAGEGLSDTLSEYQTQLKLTQEAQRATNDVLTQGYQWLLQDREKMRELGPEGVAAANLIDEATRTMFSEFDKFAKDTSGSFTGSVLNAKTTYETAVNSIIAELNKIPREIVTVHKVVSEGGEGASSGSWQSGTAPSPPLPSLPEPHDYAGPARAGQPYRIGIPEVFIPNTGGRIVPLGGAANRGDIDYDRLAAALARQPIVVQVDGQTIFAVTRRYSIRHGVGNAYLGGG